MTIDVGARIVVRTPDRREFRGRLIEIGERKPGGRVAVVRLDTGWVTSYPLHMIERDESAGTRP